MNAAGAPAEDRTLVLEALAEVHDPEIPPLSIVDLGMVGDVRVDAEAIAVDLLPTFAGCPALTVIEADVARAVAPLARGRAVRVRFVYAPPWTSDRITPRGRAALREHGLTPPPDAGAPAGRTVIPLASVAAGRASGVPCPFCGGQDTVVESAFGPTLCRSTLFCRSCRNPFEAFKPKVAGAPGPRPPGAATGR